MAVKNNLCHFFFESFRLLINKVQMLLLQEFHAFPQSIFSVFCHSKCFFFRNMGNIVSLVKNVTRANFILFRILICMILIPQEYYVSNYWLFGKNEKLWEICDSLNLTFDLNSVVARPSAVIEIWNHLLRHISLVGLSNP